MRTLQPHPKTPTCINSKPPPTRRGTINQAQKPLRVKLDYTIVIFSRFSLAPWFFPSGFHVNMWLLFDLWISFINPHNSVHG